MERKRTLWLLLDLVFLIVFNVCFFVLGGATHSISSWISYVFIHFSYLMLLITPFLVRRSTNTAVLGFPLFYLSVTYFIVEFIVGIFFMTIPFIVDIFTYRISLVVQVIIAGLYLVLLIAHMIANESTADAVAQHEQELVYVKESSARLKAIMDSIDDKKLYKKVERVYDLIHSSQVKSSSAVYDLEQMVLNLTDTLREDIESDNIDAAEETLKQIEKNAEERNRKLRNA